MLSSRFLAVSFLYIFYAAGLVAADPHYQLGGGNQLCQSVRTVTVTRTVAPGQQSPSSQPAKSPPPLVTTRPGNVNLDNGGIKTSSVIKNTKTSSVVKSTHTSSVKTHTDKNGNTNTKNTNTNTKNVNTNTKSVNTNTKNVNTKTSSVITSSTGLPTTSLPPVKTTGRSLAVSSSSTAAPPANTGNPATSLTLDPSIIQNVNGKGQAAGEADSLVSPNNFIGFCVGKTITNGKQVQTGSCNPTPIGDIPSVDNMPSAKFNSPRNFDTIAANTPFTISLQINNLVTGTFTNAANTYYAAPQQLVKGVIQGHSHVTVQKLTSLDSPDPLNPKVFDFFKGLNDVAKNGILTADVTKGLPAGVYRISSINSAGNHQEALGPVAQRGSFNDVIYITVTDGGKDANAVSSSDVLSSTVSSPAVSSTSPAVPPSTGKGGNGGKDTISSSELPVSTSTGGKKGGKGGNISSSELPVSTSTGGKKGGKGGNVVSTSAALPESTTPAPGNGKTDTKNPVVSSSASLPDATLTQGANGKGGKGPQGGNKENQKRMHKRSRRA